MSSTVIDDLRSLIVREGSGLAPLDITMLGRVAGRLEWLEMMQESVTELQAQNARYEAKITRWMPIVAASQESSELPEGWTWREPWKFSAEGPDGVVCEPKGHWPWCSEAPRPVMKVVGHRACTVQATIMANQIAIPLEKRCRVRDTREDMWPEPGQQIHRWDGDEWWSHMFGGRHDDCWKDDHLWLPAPPPPSDD